MKIKDIMTTDPATCSPDTTVAQAAQLMWEADCGFLPVLQDGAVVGVVTDRDMYIALATRNLPAADVQVGTVMGQTPITCTAEEDVQTALGRMKHARVRRLPVVGFGNTLLGVLSMNDIVRAAGLEKGPSAGQIVDTLQEICAHPVPVRHVVAA